jgi:hypothetical protein
MQTVAMAAESFAMSRAELMAIVIAAAAAIVVCVLSSVCLLLSLNEAHQAGRLSCATGQSGGYLLLLRSHYGYDYIIIVAGALLCCCFSCSCCSCCSCAVFM